MACDEHGGDPTLLFDAPLLKRLQRSTSERAAPAYDLTLGNFVHNPRGGIAKASGHAPAAAFFAPADIRSPWWCTESLRLPLHRAIWLDPGWTGRS